MIRNMSKKKRKEIKAICLGSSALGVTGSCWEIQYVGFDGIEKSIIIEAGLCQDDQYTPELAYDNNKKIVDAIKGVVSSRQCDYVFLSHCHVTSRPHWEFANFK